ncbi:gamma-glutamyl hydrolase-like isoform X1, partial [Leptotrombidium deliense]
MDSLLLRCVLLSLIVFLNLVTSEPQQVNNRPIIAILAQETNEKPNSQMISAVIVNFVEASGARVVPVFINRSAEYYEHVFNSTNGVLFPGGDLDPLLTTGYGKSAKAMFDLAVKANKRGDYYPIWGTCLGFETLSVLSSKQHYPLIKCDSWNVANALNFLIQPEYLRWTRMFRNASNEVIRLLQTENVTVNYHHFCLTPENFEKYGLNEQIMAISTNQDKNGVQFISSMEFKHYPFYGIQFHPEFVLFDFDDDMTAVPHTANAVYVSQYFSRVFVNEARKSFHSFKNKT